MGGDDGGRGGSPWLFEDHRLRVKSFFHFIDTLPGELNASVARAWRCLPAGQLISLAFDPPTGGEGWG